MKNLLNQFRPLAGDEKRAFMKEAVAAMPKIFQNDPQKMMAEMMPACMNIHKEVPDA